MKKSCLLFLLTLFFLKGYTQPSNTWTQKADFNADPVGWERAYAVGFSINGKGYIGTGSGYLNDFWEYDPVTNVWTQKANVGGMGRREAVGFSMNGKGYVGTGFGYDGSFHFLNDFWEYDPVTNVWTQKANFGGAARTGAVGFSINGKGYIGTGYNGTYFKDFWEYDPTTNLWTRKADFPGTARDEAVGFSINAKGYLGTGGDASFNYNDFWEYDPGANSWTQKAYLPSYSRAGAVGFSINNKGYIGTGYVVGLGTRKDFWEYDPLTNLWAQKADFSGAARYFAVGFNIDGKGYIGTGSLRDFWEYTPVSDNSITINPQISTTFCQTDGFGLAYSATGQYSSDNIFTAQLSDVNGNFANPINIGTNASTSSGTIQCDFNYPPPGTHYRIRVIASAPSTIGSDNGTDFEIKQNYTYYRDVDGDGFGDPDKSIQSCIKPEGYVTDNTDCDDTKKLYVDHDGDGFGAGAPVACGVADNTDCNDNDAGIHSPQTYYKDNDGDGFGGSSNTVTVCSSTPPAGYVSNQSDCDDSNAGIHAPVSFYRDADGDGFGDPTNAVSICSSAPPEGYVSNNLDCDDSKLLYADNDGDGYGAGAPVACGGVQNNNDCNDNDASVHQSYPFYLDVDGDGFGTGSPVMVCAADANTAPAGYSTKAGDSCPDTFNPDQTDTDADGIADACDPDDDADGVLDAVDCAPLDPTKWRSATAYIDIDGDGFDAGTATICYGATLPAGYSLTTNGSDCNDNDASVHSPQTYYKDSDGDGFGDPNVATTECSSTPPAGYVTNNSDCDDSKLLYADNDGDGYGTGAPVACGVADNTDCNDNDASVHSPHTYYADNDGDGFGDPNHSISECLSSAPIGYVTNNLDCDDSKLLYTDNDGDGYGAGSPVACGVADNTDCNDNDASVHTGITYYRDEDGDGFGDPNTTTTECSSTPPAGYVTNSSDCDDSKLLYTDNDGDGYGAGSPVACGVADNTDCNDNDASVHSPHTYYADNDGDGFGDPNHSISECLSSAPIGYVTNNLDCDDSKLLYADNDGDGYGTGSPVACGVADNTDCNDNDASVHTGITYYRDADGDGFGDPNTTTTECSSTPPAGYVTNNSDCDDSKLLYADNDGDAYGTGAPVACGVPNNNDCNDNNASIHPGAVEVCGNGIDDNCNGQIDEGCTVNQAPQLSISDNSITEGNNGTKEMSFKVTLDQKPTKPVLLIYFTQDGTAKALSDYIPKIGFLTFSKGVKTQTIKVTIKGDKTVEPDETFRVILGGALNATISKGTGVGTIINDDGNTGPHKGHPQNQTAVSVQEISLYPNPAQNNVNVILRGFSGSVTLRLSDLYGRTLKEYKVTANPELTQQQFNIGMYSQGTYIVTAIDEKRKLQSVKLIIAR